MKPPFGSGILLCLLIGLAGCATLSEEECRTADWRDIGLRDGRAGHPASRLGEHLEACQKHGIRPVDAQYHAGRNRGLEEYCVLSNAMREGLAGRRYQDVCPAAVHRDFEDLNDAAYAVHDARSKMESLESEMSSRERELAKDKTPEKRRREIRDELRDMDRRLVRLRDDLRWREHDLDRLSERLLRRPYR